MNTWHCLFFLWVITVCTGCAKTPSWLIGKFQFDNTRTTLQITKAAEGKTEALAGVVAGLAAAVAPQVLEEKWGNTTLTFTKSEMITLTNGSGHVVQFEVFESPSPDAVTIKTQEGKVETWRRTETGISRAAENVPALQLYFKRMKP
jgi:hypothetical protein